MRIAILTPTFSSFSGIDRVVQLQAEELSKKHDVTIMTLRADMKTQKGIKIINIGMPKNPFYERIYRLLFFFDRKKIKKSAKMLKDYDLVISHFYPMNLIAIEAKKYGVKYRYHNHGVAHSETYHSFLEKIYMFLFKILNNNSIKKADEVVSISNYLRKILKKEIGMDGKIEYDPIDTKRFNKNAKGDKIIKKFNLKNKKVLLFVGRIVPHKGVHLLIKAFNLILNKRKDVVLLIAGKPTLNRYYKELKKIIKKNVIFIGFVKDEDLPSCYAACDVYVTASLWEGFNMTVVEAQACGKPVVAFNLGPHPEVIKKGILVKPKDIKGFADATIKLLKK
jgi:1,2-diacylglycerol 3-alpha-glucosyltransferase